MQPSPASLVTALQSMTVAELRDKWQQVFGAETRQSHRAHLIKRLARRIQEHQLPKLTVDEEAKVAEYQATIRQLPPEKWFPGKQRRPRKPQRPCERRMLKPGSVVSREYGGREVAVTVREDGFEFEGQVYRSLSAVAKEVTGTTWNGWRWFGLAPKGGRR